VIPYFILTFQQLLFDFQLPSSLPVAFRIQSMSLLCLWEDRNMNAQYVIIEIRTAAATKTAAT